jgi:DNA-binding transcriptional regulator YdaS (Cro superfamily)
MRLREWLEEHGLQRVQFASLLGVHPITVTRWVTGSWVPSSEWIERITAATNGDVTANDMLAEWQDRRDGKQVIREETCGV